MLQEKRLYRGSRNKGVLRARHKAYLEMKMKKFEPMLCTLVRQPFDSDRHIFEVKYNGCRALCYKEGYKVTFIGRNGTDITACFPELQGIWRQIKWNSAVLDGEIVCLNEKGVPELNRIQHRIKNTNPFVVARLMKQYPAKYMVFDIVEANEIDFTCRAERPAPLDCRKQLLKECMIPGCLAAPVPFVNGKGIALFEEMKKIGAEGVVAKVRDSLYYPGDRNPVAWQKIKTWQKGIFKVIGYTPGKNAREEYFGALVLGEVRDGKLVHVGRAGSGPDDKELEDLTVRLRALPEIACPFRGKVNVPKGTVWVDSGINVEVQYLEYSNDGYLVNPSFKKEVK